MLNFNSFTNVVPVEDSDFVLLGKTAEYISIKDVEASVNLSLKQKKAIDLIEVGFEEDGINLLLKSYEGKDKWNKAPYMTLGSLSQLFYVLKYIVTIKKIKSYQLRRCL